MVTGNPGSTRLAGRVALVTGAGSRRGIGRAIARGLAREGARVVTADIDGDLADEAAAGIRTEGGEARGVRADVAVAADVQAMLDATLAAFGRLDILVNNAGIARIRPFLDLDEATWDRTFAVNVKSVYLCGQAAARRMIAQGGGGSIINLSSISEVVSGAGLTHYAATKAAVGNLTRGMAAELGRQVAFNARLNAGLTALFASVTMLVVLMSLREWGMVARGRKAAVPSEVPFQETAYAS